MLHTSNGILIDQQYKRWRKFGHETK